MFFSRCFRALYVVPLVLGGFSCLQLVSPDASTSTISTPPPPPIQICHADYTGLVVYLPFEDANGGGGSVTHDQSGYHNDAVLDASVIAADWVMGPPGFGHALNFNGTTWNQGIAEMPDSPSLHFTNAMTVELWFYFQIPHGVYERIIQYAEGGWPDQNWLINTNSGSGETGTTNTLGFTILDNALNTYGTPLITLPIGQWSHIAATYDGSFIHIYLNGVETTTPSPYTGTIRNNNSPHIQLGAQDTFGIEDEVKIFNRALSPAEVNLEANGCQ